MRRAQLDHLAGTDEQHLLVGDALEDTLGEAHRRGRHRDDVGADRRRRAHVLGHRKRALEQLVQRRSQRAGFARDAHGFLHLPEDLRFAEHHRIEPAGDAEGMAHRIMVRVGVEVGFDRVRGNTAVIGQPVDRRLRRVGLTVELGTVACGQDRRLVHVAAAHQIGQRAPQLFGMKRQLLAHRKRRRAVVYAESE